MLKALELIGFKSFADKTRFEFPAGITVVVGPNGSGKSNIVDAIKWVLGEQSAKSLRGKDMSDVIFKATATSGRRAVNMAEATIVFDNSTGQFPLDVPDVHVTRRVYRSGEGEYLINREPCRLRDIRNLLRGTGVGTDAYSLIEQGKVDRLLQASARDRRAMFEEAAGISRFKAKKVEAQRRLDRVDQNLLRLSDIVDEVQGRLRSVRSQAGKARRFREHQERLQQLRTHVGLADWGQLTKRLTEIEEALDQLREEAIGLSAETQQNDARVDAIEKRLNELADAILTTENQGSRNREQIVSTQLIRQQQWTRFCEFEEAVLQSRLRVAVMNNRAGDVQSQLVETTEQVQELEGRHRQLAEAYSRHQARLQTLENQIAESRVENEKRRQQYLEATRQATQLLSEVESLSLRKEQVVAEEKLARSRIAQLETELDKYRQELRVSELDEQRMVTELDEQAVILGAAEREVAEGRRVLSRRRDELAVQKGRRSAVRERISILAELEQKQEGLTTGVKYVLQQVEENLEGGFSAGCGLVADLLQASLEMAPLIDIALGSVAQHVVLSDSELIGSLASGQVEMPGRVGFVALDHLLPTGATAAMDLETVNGVVGRLDRMVQTEPAYQRLAEHLLGTTWLVKTLKDARRIRRDTGAAARFVTVAGELVDSQGAIVVGPREMVVGLVSRRSELRELNRESEVLQNTIAAAVKELGRTEENIEQQERAVRRLTDNGRTLNGGLTDCRVRLRTQAHVVEDKANELVELGQAVQNVMAQHQQVARQLVDRRGVLEEMESRLVQTQEKIEQEGQRINSEEQQRSEAAAAATAARVELATSEQRLTTLQSRQVQFQEDHRERSQAIAEAQQQLSLSVVRLGECRRAMLGATTDLAELYLRKDFFVEQVVDEKRERTDILSLREELGERGKRCRELLHKAEEKQHKKELAAGEFRLQRKSLAERLEEDYQIDITSAADNETTSEAIDERTEIEEEIVSLRQKLNNIGAVNMEALEELDELEARFTTLSTQYNDLIDAKEVLARIITRINADSRRLFMETMEAIRVNFQLLYRKAFGGGTADLVLEEGQDVLEAGVEIVTTPPGKPSFNNSLLSGGEKALTAVSLLLAIFQFRPSPFCVLDEVDAPFDEANIDRFIGVLKEFLGWTKFVIVTHSKKTMTAADTLYGVTMQESGVSKRVSVRFEDVSEDGEIDQQVVQRQQTTESAAAVANEDEEDPGKNVAAG
jgi:chromosome segregation protein